MTGRAAADRAATRGLLALAGIGVLLGILVGGRPPRPILLWAQVYDLGHIPLFGLLALLVLEALAAYFPGLARYPRRHYLAALGVTLVISVLSELAQLFLPNRETQLSDAVHNLLGASCFLGLRAFADRSLWRGEPLTRRLLATAAVIGLVAAAAPLLSLGWHYGMRAAAFPVVADLTAGWQRPFLGLPRARVRPVAAPAAWRGHEGRDVAGLTFLVAPWPGFTLREPYPDWRGYDRLRLEIFSPLDTPVDLTLRVDDVHHNQQRSDRYNRTFTVRPGLNEISIPLEQVASAPDGRRMDMSEIAQLILFARRPDDAFTLYLAPIRLERDAETGPRGSRRAGT